MGRRERKREEREGEEEREGGRSERGGESGEGREEEEEREGGRGERSEDVNLKNRTDGQCILTPHFDYGEFCGL